MSEELFYNSKQITEVYHSNTEILEIYKGNTILWSANPYEPQTQLANATGAYTFSQILGAGVYDLILSGGGGNSATWVAGGYGWGCNGGSGAVFEGEFYNPTKQTVKIVAGGRQQNSYLNFENTQMILCTAGQTAGIGSSSTAGGKITINSTLVTPSIRKSVDGAGGGGGLWNGNGGGSVCSINNWGATNTAGGIILKYIRRR